MTKSILSRKEESLRKWENFLRLLQEAADVKFYHRNCGYCSIHQIRNDNHPVLLRGDYDCEKCPLVEEDLCNFGEGDSFIKTTDLQDKIANDICYVEKMVRAIKEDVDKECIKQIKKREKKFKAGGKGKS
jgi:hypothetical protein